MTNASSPVFLKTRAIGTQKEEASFTEDAGAAIPTPSETEKKLSGELEKLKEEVKTLDVRWNVDGFLLVDLLNDCVFFQDKYKRALADSENMRKRLTKQIDDAKIFGIQSFCKDLLEVSDILVHAAESVPKEEIGNNPHLKNLYEGLSMTKSLLFQVFKRNGLEEISPTEGQTKFDPNYHEALFQQEVPNKESNVVIVVSKVGFKLHERCIRPALVGVSK